MPINLKNKPKLPPFWPPSNILWAKGGLAILIAWGYEPNSPLNKQLVSYRDTSNESLPPILLADVDDSNTSTKPNKLVSNYETNNNALPDLIIQGGITSWGYEPLSPNTPNLKLIGTVNESLPSLITPLISWGYESYISNIGIKRQFNVNNEPLPFTNKGWNENQFVLNACIRRQSNVNGEPLSSKNKIWTPEFQSFNTGIKRKEGINGESLVTTAVAVIKQWGYEPNSPFNTGIKHVFINPEIFAPLIQQVIYYYYDQSSGGDDFIPIEIDPNIENELEVDFNFDNRFIPIPEEKRQKRIRIEKNKIRIAKTKKYMKIKAVVGTITSVIITYKTIKKVLE